MRLSCSEQIKPLNLSKILHATSSPVAIQLSPFVGEMEYLIEYPLTDFSGFSCHHFNETESFTTPSYFNSFKDLPSLTYLMVIKNSTQYTVFLTLSHKDLIVNLSSCNHYSIKLSVKSGQSKEANKERTALIIVQGDNLTRCLEMTMQTALKETGGTGKLPHEKFPLPYFFDRLGWQTRPSSEEELTHDHIIESIKRLQNENTIKFGYVLIEEGWQQVSSPIKEESALLDFEADRIRFPKGLKGLIADIHELGIRQIGVWHSSMGYRGGVHQRLAKNYDLPPDTNGRYFLGYDLGRTFQFFYDYYSFLKDQGVTFIKVGDQITTSLYSRPGMDVTRLYKNLQMAIQGASTLHFQAPHLNTDCLRNENLFYWTSSRVARTAKNIECSDEKDVLKNIHHNLSTSLWLQHLMQPDFNSWIPSQNNETQAIFHALSGTFNVISHKKGVNFNDHSLKKMILPSGNILKADKTLTICNDSIFVNPLEDEGIYKAYTMKNKSGVVALFPCGDDKKTQNGLVSSIDVETMEGDYFTAFSYRHGFLGILKKEEQLPVKLKPQQSDIITFSPLRNGVSLVGCYSFFLTHGPIHEWTIEEDALHISSMIAAPLLLYSERQILEIRWNGQPIPWSYDIRLKIVSIDQRSHIVDSPSLYTVYFEA